MTDPTDPAPTSPHESGGVSFEVLEKEVPPPSQVNDTLILGFGIATAVFGVLFAVALLGELPLWMYGSALALALLCLGVAVRRFFTDRFPDITAAEPREIPTAPPDDPVSEIEPLARRPFLLRVLIGAGAALGLSFLAPVSSLGPAPGNALRTTRWSHGVRVVTTDGEPLRPEDVAVGGISTAWPEGAIGHERSAVSVLRLVERPQPPTIEQWVVQGEVVAYSKICTHAGCPVALFRERDNALFCPCHQSTFDASRGAVPTFGPAARALPQLPLGVADGYLVALGDFDEQVGPAFG